MDSPLKFRVIAITALSTFALGLGGILLFSKNQETSVLSIISNKTQAPSSEQTPQTLDEFKIAYEQAPNATTASSYAHELMIEGQWEEAQKILNSTSEESQELFYEKALFNVLQNHPETAQKEFEAAMATSGPISPATLQNFITTFQNFTAAQGAEPIYLKALLCKALVDAEEFDLATLLAQQTVNEKNDYRDVWILLGYAELKKQKLGDAEDAFRQAKKIDSLKPEVHYFLGSTLSQEQKHEEAIDELELSLLYGFEPAEEVYKKIAEAQEVASEQEAEKPTRKAKEEPSTAEVVGKSITKVVTSASFIRGAFGLLMKMLKK